MSLIPPDFLDCVVALGYPAPTGTNWSATGFLYGRRQPGANPDNTYNLFLVTARHVVETHPTMVVRMNPAPGQDAREFPAALIDANGRQLWMSPTDRTLDIAALPIQTQMLQQQNIPVHFFASDQHTLFLDSDEGQHRLSEGDGVFVLGFPMREIGTQRNYAIVRNGCIARIRDSLSNTSRTFLVDANVFPGNSGGPVLIRPEVVSIEGTQPVGRSALIGVASGYLSYSDTAVSQQTQRPRVVFEENSGLSVVIPVDAVRDLIERIVVERP